MTRTAHIQNPPAWPTTPGINHTDRTAPLLLEEKGLGDEVDATKKGLGVALSEAEGDEVDWPVELSIELYNRTQRLQ